MSILSSINARFQSIDTVHVEIVTNAAPHSLPLAAVGLNTDTFNRALEGFHLLLYCPTEYLSKSWRADILRRAVTLDMTLTAVEPVENGSPRASRVVRTFLQRTFCALGAAEHQVRDCTCKAPTPLTRYV